MFYILCWYYSYIDIDIYGGNSCSKLKCSGNCMDMVNTTYKFYLSFENSLCKDYITEKFWKVLPYNVIPIVLNGVDMSTLAPYHSYIDIKDFPSFEGGWRDDKEKFFQNLNKIDAFTHNWKLWKILYYKFFMIDYE